MRTYGFLHVFPCFFSSLLQQGRRTPKRVQNEEKVFSGKVSEYKDDYDGYNVKLPVEYQVNDRWATTDWNGLLMEGMAVSVPST